MFPPGPGQGEFTNRPAEKTDLPLICDFPRSEKELFFFFPRAVFPLTPDQLLDSVRSRADSTVILADGRVVGFANFYAFAFGGRCSLGNLIVAPEARGRGAASYLVKAMISLALSKYQAREVHVACFNENAAGLILYAQLGFAPFDLEERRDREGRRVALVHLKWEPGHSDQIRR